MIKLNRRRAPILMSGQYSPSGQDPKDLTAVIRPNMLKTFPQLAKVKIDYAGSGAQPLMSIKDYSKTILPRRQPPDIVGVNSNWFPRKTTL
jgi:hypothetical protein